LLEQLITEAEGNPVHIHTLETKTQREYGLRKYGKSPVTHLRDIGLLKPNVTCAHCVWLDEDDIASLAATGAKVAHNPSSNLRLRSGIARTVRLLDAGVQVGLGLDGQALNDDQDIWQEMRLAKGLAFERRASGAFVSGRDVLSMATKDGAAITGGPLRGELLPGNMADLVAIRLDRIVSPYLDVRIGILDAVLGRGKPLDVDTVIVGGEIRVDGGNPAGQQLKEVRARLASALGVPKSEGQLLREALAAQLGPYLQDLYAGW
jgi:cytosine/adenosine deaminase-related metal-dependent hydrolase